MKETILIVDDEPSVLSSLLRCLRNDRYDIVTTLSGEDALRLMRIQKIAVVISDQSMVRLQGMDFLLLVKKHCPETVRILLTGYANVDLAVAAVNQGEVFRFLTKPWDDAELRQIVAAAVDKYQAGLNVASGVTEYL